MPQDKKVKQAAQQYTVTGNPDTDFDNIAKFYKPTDLDDETWRGMWRNIMLQESRGDLMTGESQSPNQSRVRGERAYGVMQVLPETGRGLGFTDEELKNPYYNFMAGVKNLRNDYEALGKDKRVASPSHRITLAFAAYHAGLPRVLESLNAGEDGVPNISDGSVNTRDYTINKVTALQDYLEGRTTQTQQEAAAPQEQEQMRFDLSQPSPTDIKTDKPFTGVIGRNLPAWKKPPTNFDEFLMEQDRQIREELGLITPENYPLHITAKPVMYKFELQPGEKLTPARIVDAIVTQLTGDATAHQRFQEGVGHPVLKIFEKEADDWLRYNIENGLIKVDEVVTPQGAKTIVRGATPAQSLIMRQINAFAKGGKEAVDAENALMTQEIAAEERRAAELKYGKMIDDLNARADTAEYDYIQKLTPEEREKMQPEDFMNSLSPEAKKLRMEAGVLQAELERRFPTTMGDEIWKGVKRATAGALTSYRGLVRNIKEIGEAVLYTNDKQYIEEGTKRDKQYRETVAQLRRATPETRRLLAGVLETVQEAVTFDAPVYLAGGAVMGPSGLIYTTALRSADKPIDEFARDMATAILEVPIGKAIGGIITKGGYKFGKQELGEKVLGRIASEGGGEALSDMTLDFLEGKKLDWKQAIKNFAAGGAFGFSGGGKSKEGATDAERQIAPQTEMFQMMSPIGVAIGKDGKNRYQVVIKVGEDVGLVEVQPEHPLIVKYAAQAEAGGIPFITFTEDQFDQALEDFKGTGNARLPKMTAEQTKEFLEGKKDEEAEKQQGEGTVTDDVVPEQQQQPQVEKEIEEAEQRTESGTGVLTQPKTFRRYKNRDWELDEDLGRLWDAAESEYKEAYRVYGAKANELSAGIIIKAGHQFSKDRQAIIAEQTRRENEAKKQAGKEIVKEPDFELGTVVKVDGVEVRLPDNLANKWKQIQEDYKGAYKSIIDDATLSFDEKNKKISSIDRQKVDAQRRVINEYKKQEQEGANRGYMLGSNRPLTIIEDRGEQVVVKLAGEDATRVVSREDIETRKERALKPSRKLKLPLSVRTKSALGAFKEGKQASVQKDGVVYINNTTASKIEDVLESIDASNTVSFTKENVDEAIQDLRDAELDTIANQLEKAKEASNGKPSIINLSGVEPSLAAARERVKQATPTDKRLPRDIVESTMRDGGAIDVLLQKTPSDIKDGSPDDIIQNVLAYGLTGDYEGLGVDADTLYDATVEAVQSYVEAFPNEELGKLFDAAVVDIDLLKSDAARRIKYGKPKRGEEAVRPTGRTDKKRKKRRGEKSAEEKVRQVESRVEPEADKGKEKRVDKKKALAKVVKVELPADVVSYFDITEEGEIDSYATDGVVFVNREAQEAIDEALDIKDEVRDGVTFSKFDVPRIVEELRKYSLGKIATQLEQQLKGRDGVAIVPVYKENVAETASHERIHTRLYHKNANIKSIQRFYSSPSAQKLIAELNTPKNGMVHPMGKLKPTDFIQEVLAYGLTGDYKSLGVSPDALYDALLDVIEMYIRDFPAITLDRVADLALVDFTALREEAGKRIPLKMEPRKLKSPWTMSYEEMTAALDAIAEADTKKELEVYVPLLRALFPDYTDTLKPNDKNDFAFGIWRAVNRGDEAPRIPRTDLPSRYRIMIEDARARDEEISPEAEASYMNPSVNKADTPANRAIIRQNIAAVRPFKNASHITDVPAFQKWFEGSKVVDKNGNPLILFHGTGSQIEEFDESRINREGHPTAIMGLFFTPNPELASGYADWYTGQSSPNVIPVYLNMQKPYIMSRNEMMEFTKVDEFTAEGRAKTREKALAFKENLVKQGYDGIISSEGKYQEYIVFNGKQVRSLFSFSSAAVVNKAVGNFLVLNHQGRRPEWSAREENFKNWFRNSEVTYDGEPLMVFHGTTHDFEAFNQRKANLLNFIGKGFYFSTSPGDAAKNYGIDGADLIGRINQRIETYMDDHQDEAYDLEREQRRLTSKLIELERELRTEREKARKTPDKRQGTLFPFRDKETQVKRDKLAREIRETRAELKEVEEDIEKLTDYDTVFQTIKSEMTGGRQVVIVPAYLNPQKVFDISRNAATDISKRLDQYTEETTNPSEAEYTDDDGVMYKITGSLWEFKQNLYEVTAEFVGDEMATKVLNHFNEDLDFLDESMTHKRAHDLMVDALLNNYVDERYQEEDYTAQGITGEIKRRVIQMSGFDGFKMTPSDYFPQLMVGYNHDLNDEVTSHYVVWEPNRVKSPYNEGTFSVDEDRILKKVDRSREQGQEDAEPDGTARKIEAATKEWFGTSAVIDKDGNPMILYHGTGSNIESFKAGKQNQKGNPTAVWGIFFTPNPEYAADYARANFLAENFKPYQHASVYPVHLKIEKPYYMSYNEFNSFTKLDELNEAGMERAREKARSFAEALQDAGYDGIVIAKDSRYPEYVVFQGKQVRSIFELPKQSTVEGLSKVKRNVAPDKESLRKSAEKATKKDVRNIVEKKKFAVISGGVENDALKTELNKMGFETLDAEGTMKDKSEPSLFVILNSDKEAAHIIRLGIRYKQKNIIIGASGEYRAPYASEPKEAYSGENVALFDADAKKQTGRTVVKTSDGDITFSIPDLFAATRKGGELERINVAALQRAYANSFKNPAKATSADLLDWFKQREKDGKREVMSTAETAKFLEAQTAKMYGKPPDRQKQTKEVYESQVVRRSVRDLIAKLEYNLLKLGADKAREWISWYNDAVQKMHHRTGQVFKEVTRGDSRLMTLLFDLTLALSSPANKVNQNFMYTTKIWKRVIEEFQLGRDGNIYPLEQDEKVLDKETGEMRPKKYGKFGPLLEKFNLLSQGYRPVKSAEARKLKAKGVELKRTENYSDFSGATQWYVKDDVLEALIEKHGYMGGVFEYLHQPSDSPYHYFKATELLGPKVGAFFLNLIGWSQFVTVDMWISRWFYRINGGLVKPDGELQDDPKGMGNAALREGNLIRGIHQAAAQEWNRKHPDMKLKPQDVQAINWGDEKELWFLAGAEDSGNVNYYDAAELRFTPEVTADIDGTQQMRDDVIIRWQEDFENEVGPETAKAFTDEAKEEGARFYMKTLNDFSRVGLGHTTRKQVVDRKLANFDSVEWNKQMERAKGEALTSTETAKLFNMLQEGFQAADDKQRRKVQKKLMNFRNDLAAQSLIQFLLLVRKAGLLTGVKTIGRNMLSNFAFAVLEEFRRGFTGPIDMTIALAFGKERVAQGISPRGVYEGTKRGLAKGIPAFFKTLFHGDTGFTFEDIGYDPKVRASKMIGGRFGAGFLNKTVGNYAKYVFRFQSAQDALFRSYATGRAMYELAWLKYKNEGIPIADSLANPSVIESDFVIRAAEAAVFQNDNALNTTYQRLKSKAPAPVRYLLDYRIPFFKTGSNIFLKAMDFIGVGGIYRTVEYIDGKDWKEVKKNLWEAIDTPEVRRTLIESYSRGLLGLGLMYIGWTMAAKGLLEGMDDDDEKERQKRIAKGSGAGHMKLGDSWYDIRGLSPVGTVILAGASAQQAWSKDLKDESKRFDAMMSVASDIVVDGLPLARTAVDFLAPEAGRSMAQKLIAAESLVPSLIAEIAASQDTVQRDTKGEGLIENIKKSVQLRIPGQRKNLEAKTDVFGRELEQPSGFDPFATKTAVESKVLRETADVDWSYAPPKRNIKEGETEEAFRKRKKKTQELVIKMFEAVVDEKRYDKFTKEERKGILDESANIARATVREGGKLTNDEVKDIVDAVLLKAKDKSEIDADKKLTDEEKETLKQRFSSKYSKIISPATKD